MHRQSLLDMLRRYAQLHPAELAEVERITTLVTSSPDCFERTCRPGHITGSAWVLSRDRQKCLLVHHRKLDRWLQPGGHADGETDVAQVALREAQEESGLQQLHLARGEQGLLPLDVDVHLIPARYDAEGNLKEDAHEHHDVRFLVIAEPDQTLVLSDESHDLGWFTREELLNLTDEESVLRMQRKAGPH